MTICAWDGKTLAADALHAYTDYYTVAELKSKIDIVNQMAVVSAGDAMDCEMFCHWLAGENPDTFPEMSEPEGFEALVLDTTGRVRNFSVEGKRGENISHRLAIGATGATHYLHALLDSGFNLLESMERVCEYSLLCRPPIYSITLAQLRQIPPDYFGLWTGTSKSNVREMFEAYDKGRGKPKK